MEEIINWLYEYLTARGRLPGNDREEQLAADFFEAGLIDSFGVIELITEIESRFKVRFKPEHMQDVRFRTVKGLAQIIGEAGK